MFKMLGSFLLGCLICTSSIMLVSFAVDNKNMSEELKELKNKDSNNESKKEEIEILDSE